MFNFLQMAWDWIQHFQHVPDLGGLVTLAVNAVYPLYKQSILNADTNVNLTTDTTVDGPFTSLVNTGTYTYSAAHQYFNSVTGVVGTDQRITSPAPTVTVGTLAGGNLAYTAVSGAVVQALIIYRHNSGANTTWRLVLFMDTGVTGFPVTPNGGNITVTWNGSGIFTICDRRLKRDLVQVGKAGRTNLYEFSYIWDQKRRHVGPIAQEVEQHAPEAVVTFGRRWKAVDQSLALAA
jgi:hypothetical protein